MKRCQHPVVLMSRAIFLTSYKRPFIIFGSVGAADIEQARLITDNTVFHIAPLSKQITAAALVHVLQDDLLSLDDLVGKWIPEAQKYGGKLTIAHLVYMTSGLTEYTDSPGPGGRPWPTFHYFTTDDAIVASLSVDDLRFPPGLEWRYSNVIIC
jgi:D-alanyl-D-alanine carboxypeptidase